MVPRPPLLHTSLPSPPEATAVDHSEYPQTSAALTPSNQPSDGSPDTRAFPDRLRLISSDNLGPSHEASKTPPCFSKPWPASTAETPSPSAAYRPISSPPQRRPVDGLRIAWSPDFGFADVDPDVARITHQATLAFQDLGCTVDEIDITLLEPYDSFGIIQSATAYNSYAKYLPEYGDQMTEYARFWVEKGSQVTTADYAAALGRINELKAIFDDVFATYDLILAPVARFPAFINEPFPGSITGTSSYPEQFWNGAFTMHANATGSPAASVPAGFTPQGLPVGLQIIGRKYDEETVLAASAAFEQNHPWIHNHPPTL